MWRLLLLLPFLRREVIALHRTEAALKKAQDQETLRIGATLLLSLLHKVERSHSELTSAVGQLCSQLGSEPPPAADAAAAFNQQKQTALTLARMARISVAAQPGSRRVPRPISRASEETPATQATLERDVWAIITDRYFRSWPFYGAITIFALGVGFLGFAVGGAMIDANAIRDRLEQAKQISYDHQESLRKESNTALQSMREQQQSMTQLMTTESEQSREKVEEVRQTAQQDITNAKNEALEALAAAVDGEAVFTQIVADFTAKVQSDLEGKLGEIDADLVGATEATLAEFGQLRGIESASLSDLVEHDLNRIERQIDRSLRDTLAEWSEQMNYSFRDLDDFVKFHVNGVVRRSDLAFDTSLAAFGKRNGINVNSVEDLAAYYIRGIGEAVDSAIAGSLQAYADERQTDMDDFDDLVRYHIDSLQRVAEQKAQEFESSQDVFSVEIETWKRGLNEGLAELENRQATLAQSRDAVQKDLMAVQENLEPLRPLATKLENEFYRYGPVQIATVLGQTALYVFLAFGCAALAMVLAVIALWRTVRPKGQAATPTPSP